MRKPRDEEEKICVGMTAVGFEPTQLALVELESTPLDHSGKLSLWRFTHLSFAITLKWCCPLEIKSI